MKGQAERCEYGNGLRKWHWRHPRMDSKKASEGSTVSFSSTQMEPELWNRKKERVMMFS